MPDSTPLLQTLDTNCFAPFKKNVLVAKAQVHEMEEAAFRQVGLNYEVNWGPRQLSTVISRAWANEQKRARETNWNIQCAVENQLWVWRPDAQGNTIGVDDDPTLQDIHRMPPSKGIVPQWASQRMDSNPHEHGQGSSASRC